MCYDINGIVGIRGDIVTFKRLLIILSFAVTVLIVILLGTSYAWYTFDNAVTSFNNVINMDKKELNEVELNFKSVRTSIDFCSNQINNINTKLNSAETIVKTLKEDIDNCKNKIVDNHCQ